MKKSVQTTHHILPRSRGGSDDKSNLARVAHKEHDLYHQLFSNKTPKEILAYLSANFWKNQNKEDGDKFIAEYYQTVIFAKYCDNGSSKG
jgi:hypothetical protein